MLNGIKIRGKRRPKDSRISPLTKLCASFCGAVTWAVILHKYQLWIHPKPAEGCLSEVLEMVYEVVVELDRARTGPFWEYIED
jgi:hypothetical protein